MARCPPWSNYADDLTALLQTSTLDEVTELIRGGETKNRNGESKGKERGNGGRELGDLSPIVGLP